MKMDEKGSLTMVEKGSEKRIKRGNRRYKHTMIDNVTIH